MDLGAGAALGFGLAVLLVQLDAENPAAAREAWRRLRHRWKAEGVLGVGPAHGWAGPEATGVSTTGIAAFESVVDAALAAYAKAGGTGGPLVLRGGRPVAPTTLASGSLAP